MNKVSGTTENPWPVIELTTKLKDYIDQLGLVWVEGEITQWDQRSSGIFGRLKDLTEDSTMGITIWNGSKSKIPDDIKQGDRVIALVKVDFWKKTGNLGLNVLELRHVGLGDLLEKLEKLRKQLAKEGLFDADRKVPLPFLPQCIGLITGQDSDAEKDVLRNAHLRWPQVTFKTIHTKVQGDQTVPEVISAIHKLDADPDVDVIIIARGGGDFQNLLPFSDEKLVRAAAACVTPLVSAIGHEADCPLLDNVADLRASTPTDAAKRVVPDVAEEIALVTEAQSRMANTVTGFISHEFDRLESLRTRPVLTDSEWIISSRAEEIIRTIQRGSDLVNQVLHRAEVETQALSAQLRSLSPQQTLDRGYAIAIAADGTVIRSATDAPDKTQFDLTLAQGVITAVSSGAKKVES